MIYLTRLIDGLWFDEDETSQDIHYFILASGDFIDQFSWAGWRGQGPSNSKEKFTSKLARILEPVNSNKPDNLSELEVNIAGSRKS